MQTPNIDHTHRPQQEKHSNIDDLTLKLCDIPPSMNQAELELHLGPVAPYTKIKILTRAVDRKSYAFISFKARDLALNAVRYLKKHSFLKDKRPLEIEYPAHDSTETDLDKRTVHLTNLPHNVNKVIKLIAGYRIGFVKDRTPDSNQNLSESE